MKHKKSLVVLIAPILFFSCSKEERIEQIPTRSELCLQAVNNMYTQTFVGSFFPCRSDGLNRKYPAAASFDTKPTSLEMHLRVPALKLDTIVVYDYWCEYYPLEPVEKITIDFKVSENSEMSSYNAFYNSVNAWFQYESNCELALFSGLGN